MPRTSLSLRVMWPVLGLGAYTVAASIWLASMWDASETAGRMSAWVPLPAQLAVLCLIGARVAHRRLDPEVRDTRRTFWWLMFTAVAINLVATIGWTYLAAINNTAYGTWGEALYLLSYPVLAVAYFALFCDAAGSLRSPRVWLDIVTLALGLGVMLWPLLIAPLLGRADADPAETLTTVGYVLGTVISTIPAVLLYMQVMDWRTERAMSCVIAFAIGSFMIDSWWVAYDARGEAVPGAFYNALYCGLYTLLAAAAIIDRPNSSRPDATHRLVGNSYSFVPAFAVLLAIGMLAAQPAGAHGFTGSVPVFAALVGAALVAARQFYARFDMQRLHTELAKRQADERLTELVRRSADAIAVIGVDGRFSYLSPAAERLFGAPVEALVGRSTADLFGSKGALRLGALAAPSDSDSIADVELVTSSGERKLLQIAANNQSANPVIAGVVLTVHDVTEQRRVEQEILDVATRERQLLSRNVHEGLAQELTGVALMLNALNRRSNDTSAPAQASLDAVIRYVSEAIGGVRQLAVSLSPLQIASGSLQLALNGLARDVSTHSAIRVSTDWHLGDQVLPDGVADHLYHIVQEAISHAAEDTQCREVRICLRGVPLGLELSIESNGAGARFGVAAGDGRSLRLIAYRVRLLGGTLRVDGSAGGGTHIVAVTPIPVALPGQG